MNTRHERGPWAVPLTEAPAAGLALVGGKAAALGELAAIGAAVPRGVVVTTAAYHAFLDTAGLRERILLELSRKPFEEMRWEELWDASLRIRHLFLTTEPDDELAQALLDALRRYVPDGPVAVRSSAPGEDSAGASFAGMHESFVNVLGGEQIARHVRLVWASLWSDRALLYRRELGLDVADKAMAVIVQELIAGEASGIVFSQDPADGRCLVIEAVHGLNQGLVDGAVEPDRWRLDRETGAVLDHRPADRLEMMARQAEGVRLIALPEALRRRPPLSEADLAAVRQLALSLERHFGRPQDVEWTSRSGRFYALQSRPITTGAAVPDDARRGYLELRRSFANLQQLRRTIEAERLPAMRQEAAAMAVVDLGALTDEVLEAEVQRRRDAYERWLDVYAAEFIPFAHGARLFGEVYNDRVRPSDPYEFVDLLLGSPMQSTHRNQLMAELADRLRDDSVLRERVMSDQPFEGVDDTFDRTLSALLREFGDTVWADGRLADHQHGLLRFLAHAASGPTTPAGATGDERPHRSAAELEREYEAAFPADERAWAAELLDLARASWRLRDDDNVYLGRIEGQLVAGEEELRRRFGPPTETQSGQEGRQPSLADERQSRLRARQLTGHPASPGVASGPARVVGSTADLFTVQHGEVLVCDAIDPNMTFVVPLTAAIVERRGGMLIHGAIIAREYGVPCVTGIAHATELIATGDRLTVDGYLGIVVIG